MACQGESMWPEYSGTRSSRSLKFSCIFSAYSMGKKSSSHSFKHEVCIVSKTDLRHFSTLALPLSEQPARNISKAGHPPLSGRTHVFPHWNASKNSNSSSAFCRRAGQLSIAFAATWRSCDVVCMFIGCFLGVLKLSQAVLFGLTPVHRNTGLAYSAWLPLHLKSS